MNNDNEHYSFAGAQTKEHSGTISAAIYAILKEWEVSLHCHNNIKQTQVRLVIQVKSVLPTTYHVNHLHWSTTLGISVIHERCLYWELALSICILSQDSHDDFSHQPTNVSRVSPNDCIAAKWTKPWRTRYEFDYKVHCLVGHHKGFYPGPGSPHRRQHALLNVVHERPRKDETRDPGHRFPHLRQHGSR